MADKNKNYIDSVHFWGKIWSVGALLVLLSLPIAFCAKYDAFPAAKDVLNGLKSVVLIYWTTAIA